MDYVGSIDHDRCAVCCARRHDLFLLDHASLCDQLFYQLAIRCVGDFPQWRLGPKSLSVEKLVRLAAERLETQSNTQVTYDRSSSSLSTFFWRTPFVGARFATFWKVAAACRVLCVRIWRRERIDFPTACYSPNSRRSLTECWQTSTVPLLSCRKGLISLFSFFSTHLIYFFLLLLGSLGRREGMHSGYLLDACGSLLFESEHLCGNVLRSHPKVFSKEEVLSVAYGFRFLGSEDRKYSRVTKGIRAVLMSFFFF